MATETRSLEERLTESTEVRRHNGQCAYGEWIEAASEDVPAEVRGAVLDEIAEAHCRDMRREKHTGNTAEAGTVEVGGQRWVYRR